MQQQDLQHFFHNVYRIYHPRLRSKNTVVQYESVLRTLNRFHEKTKGQSATTADLSAELILGAAAELVNRRGRSPATANRVIRTAVAMWREAARRGLSAELPKEPLPQYDEPKSNPVAWWPEELERTLQATQAEQGYVGPVPSAAWFQALILMVFWTGARISAVMSIEVENLDTKNNTVKILAEHQKHKADGLYDLPGDLVELIDSFGLQMRGVSTLFGDWPYDRHQPGWRALNRRLAEVQRRAGLPATRKDMWHKIRRTHATQVAAARGIATAQKMLGHSSARVTERYVDPSQIPRERATEILKAPSMTNKPAFRIVG